MGSESEFNAFDVTCGECYSPCTFVDYNARGYPVFHCGKCNRNFSRKFLVRADFLSCPKCGARIPYMRRSS